MSSKLMRACLIHLVVSRTIVLIVSALVVPDIILYESDRVLAINKPAGISHHNERTGELGILSEVRRYYNNSSINDEYDDDDENVENNNNGKKRRFRLYGVHRLDRVTSGILLFAKDVQMAQILSTAFRENKVIKYYVGISNRKPKKKKQGWIKGNMIRGRRKSWYLESSSNKNKFDNNDNDNNNEDRASSSSSSSNYAITRFFSAGLGGLGKHLLSLQENFIDLKEGQQQKQKHQQSSSSSPSTCILFRPHTGKTHQLRVAAKSVGLGLLGDPIYGDSVSPSAPNRTFLHATAIHIPLPLSVSSESESVVEDDPGAGADADGIANDGRQESSSSITIYCPPPFADLLYQPNAHDEFEQVLDLLFQKNCECPEILFAKNNEKTIHSI